MPGVEIVGTDRAKDDVQALNEESDDVDGDLEVADVCWQGEEIRLLKEEDKKILKWLREVISEKTQLPLLKKGNVKELKKTVELVNSVIHNV